jgi:hypothetical protein
MYQCIYGKYPTLTFNLTFYQNNSDIVSRTYSITVMLFAVTLNICCIIVLCKSKSLQENRFYVLTIYLSITDLGTSLAATVMSLWIMSDTSTFAPYACILICRKVTIAEVQRYYIYMYQCIYGKYPTLRTHFIEKGRMNFKHNKQLMYTYKKCLVHSTHYHSNKRSEDQDARIRCES